MMASDLQPGRPPGYRRRGRPRWSFRPGLPPMVLGYLVGGCSLAWATGMSFSHALTWVAILLWPLVVIAKIAWLVLQAGWLIVVSSGVMWTVYACVALIRGQLRDWVSLWKDGEDPKSNPGEHS